MKIKTPKNSKLWNYIFGKFKSFHQHKATLASTWSWKTELSDVHWKRQV